MLIFFSAILGISTGFGIVTLIFALILEKSNNIGDSVGAAFYYAKRPQFYATLDNRSNFDCQEFARRNALEIPREYEEPDYGAQVRRFDPSEMKIVAEDRNAPKDDTDKIEETLDDGYDFDNDLPEVEIPLFKPLN